MWNSNIIVLLVAIVLVLVSMRAGWGNSYASEYDSVGEHESRVG